MVCQGLCKQSDIVRVFGVSAKSVKRYVAKYRQEGIASFYQPRKTRGATVITNELILQAQERLTRGLSRREVADDLGIKYDTLRKAINQGRLREPTLVSSVDAPQVDASANDQPTGSIPHNASSDLSPPQASDKSLRSEADAAAEMGVGCTRPIERVLAAVGLLNGATTEFEDCRDVTFGGVPVPYPPWRQTVCSYIYRRPSRR